MPLYRETTPPAPLRPFVRCLWELVADPAERCGGPLERVLPDGCMEWMFHVGTPFRIERAPGVLERQEHALVGGVTTRALLLEPTPDAWVLGVRFEPGHGWAHAGLAARELVDHVASADHDPWFAEVTERLHDAPPDERMDRLGALLLARFAGAPRPRRTARDLGRAAGLLVAGRATVDQVAHACGLSPRQLQRRFLDEVGVGPKHLSRIARFARAAERVAWTDEALTAVAHATGYADQSHFAREFRQMAGLTPRQYRAETHGLADAFAASGPTSHSF
ncbi:MAG: helix-turn-helix transcriptional regulator [Planctomycetota bacterium]